MTQRTSLYAEESHKSPALAAVLSFFIPGLGQIYAGRLVRGLLLAIPQTVVILVLIWAYLQDPVRLGGLVLVNGMAIAILNVLFLFYRAYAVIDAYMLARGSGGFTSSRKGLAAGAIALVLLLTANVAVHGYVAYNSFLLDRTVSAISPSDCNNLDPDQPRPRSCPRASSQPAATPAAPTPTLAPGETAIPTPTLEPGATPAPAATPVPTLPPGTPYWAENGRLDVLLLGADSAPSGGRSEGLRTDTMIVASVDIATGKAALFGIPRNVINAPLPDNMDSSWPCHCIRGYLFGTGTYVGTGQISFKDGDKNKYRGVSEVIQHLLGVELDGLVLVDLRGFVKTIDALGGITIDVPEAVFERVYRDENNDVETVNIKKGVQDMDGHTALKYVRSRHQDSDYGRMGRQQNFLRAVRAQFTACNILPRLPALLEAAGDAVRTDIPLEEVPALVELMSRSKQPRRFEFIPGRGYPSDWGDPATIAKVRDAVAQGFAPRSGSEDPAEPDPSLPPPPPNPC